MACLEQLALFSIFTVLAACASNPLGTPLSKEELQRTIYGNTIVYNWSNGDVSKSYTAPSGDTYYYSKDSFWKGKASLPMDGWRQVCFEYNKPIQQSYCTAFTRENGKLMALGAMCTEKQGRNNAGKCISEVSRLFYPDQGRMPVHVESGDSIDIATLEAKMPKKLMGTLLSDEVVGAALLAYGAAVVAGVRQAFEPVELPEHCADRDYYKSLDIIVERGWLIPRTARSYKVTLKGESCFHEEEKAGKRGFLVSSPVSFSGLPQDNYNIEISGYDDIDNTIFSAEAAYAYSGKEDVECVFDIQGSYAQCRKRY